MLNTYSLSITTPANTTKSTPQITVISLKETLINALIYFTDSIVSGQTGFYIKLASGQTFPDPGGSPDLYFYPCVYPCNIGVHASQPFPYKMAISTYNLDATNPHTVYIVLEVESIQEPILGKTLPMDDSNSEMFMN